MAAFLFPQLEREHKQKWLLTAILAALTIARQQFQAYKSFLQPVVLTPALITFGVNHDKN